MISPKEVAPTHRKLAYAIFSLLLLSFFAAASLTIYEAVKQRANPPTQFKKVKESVRLPQFQICPYDGITVTYISGAQVCDYSGPPVGDNTIKPADQEWPVKTCQLEYESEGSMHCITINKNRAVVLSRKGDWMYLSMRFNATFTVPSGQLLGQLFEIFPYPTDETATPTTTEVIPYSIPFPSLSVVFIQESQFKKLDGKLTREHTLRVSSATNVRGTTAGEGQYFLDMEIKRENLRVDLNEETDPLNITILIGVLSGFWGYVTLIYSFFFVETGDKEYKWCFAKNEAKKLEKTIQVTARGLQDEEPGMTAA